MGRRHADSGMKVSSAVNVTSADASIQSKAGCRMWARCVSKGSRTTRFFWGRWQNARVHGTPGPSTAMPDPTLHPQTPRKAPKKLRKPRQGPAAARRPRRRHGRGAPTPVLLCGCCGFCGFCTTRHAYVKRAFRTKLSLTTAWTLESYVGP